MPITSLAAWHRYVQCTGTVDGPHKQERSLTMNRQTRLNITALIVALPMVLIALSTGILQLSLTAP